MGDSWKFYLVLVGRFLSIDFLPNLVLVLILRSEKQKKYIQAICQELWLHLFSYIQKLLRDKFYILEQFFVCKTCVLFSAVFLLCRPDHAFYIFY